MNTTRRSFMALLAGGVGAIVARAFGQVGQPGQPVPVPTPEPDDEVVALGDVIPNVWRYESPYGELDIKLACHYYGHAYRRGRCVDCGHPNAAYAGAKSTRIERRALVYDPDDPYVYEDVVA